MYRYSEQSSHLQPREKAQKYGINNLSDRELISLMLGSGSKANPVEKLSKHILDLIDKTNGTFSIDDLLTIKGVGRAKATLLSAAMEFSRRRLSHKVTTVSYPTDILPSIRHYVTRPQEYFIAVLLNGAHEIIKTDIVSIGILNRTLIHPREVFSDALKERAASVILAHNHPSGNLEPSPEDLEVTRRLVEVGELIGIKVLDHIIFSQKDYYSFLEHSKI